jgi:hypothetical protein
MIPLNRNFPEGCFLFFTPLIRLMGELESLVVMTYDAPLSGAQNALMLGSLLLFLWAFFQLQLSSIFWNSPDREFRRSSIVS